MQCDGWRFPLPHSAHILVGWDILLGSVLRRKNKKNSVSRKVPRKLPALAQYWSNFSPCPVLTLPVPQIESNALAVAHWAELESQWWISDLVRDELGAEMHNQDTTILGNTPWEDFRHGSLPQKLMFCGWVEFLLFNSHYAFQCLFLVQSLLVGVEWPAPVLLQVISSLKVVLCNL